MSDKLNDDWYCPTCEDYVSGESVTFEEVHVVCGTFIGENWQKTKAALEQRVEELERGLRELSDPMAYEHIGKFHGRRLPWSIAREALAQQEGA